MLIVNERLRIPLREIELTFARASGPGGQNVNKVSSKAILRWPVRTSPSLPEDIRSRLMATFPNRITQAGDLVITSARYRDQARNVQDCLDKLRAMLARAAFPPAPRRPTRPRRRSIEERLRRKRSRGEKKELRRTPAPEE